MVGRLRRVPPVLVLGVGLVLATACWIVLQHAEPYLGHDESVYALKARSWVNGDPAAGWGVHRPLGLPLLGFFALQVSDTTGAVRAVGLVLALLTILTVYLVAARLTTARRAAVAVLVMISGATFLRRLPEFLNDISSSGLLLLTGYLIARSRQPGRSAPDDGDGPPRTTAPWALPVAALTAVLALVVRYGAGAGLVAIAVAALLVYGPRTWLRAWREVLAAAAASVVLLVPLVVYSHRVTGSWIGVITHAAGAADASGSSGPGIIYYAKSFPYLLAGPVGAIVIAAGVAFIVSRRASRELTFLGVAGIIQVLLLGVVAHGETRFIYFAVLALTIAGVEAIATWAGSGRAAALTGAAVLALAATAVTLVAVDHALVRLTRDYRPTATVSAQIERTRTQVPAAARPPCVVITDLQVLSAWITHCDARQPSDTRVLPPRAHVYVIDVPDSDGSGDDMTGRTTGTRPGRVLRAELARYPHRDWSVTSVRGHGWTGYLATS